MYFHSHNSVPYYVLWNSLQKEEVNPVKSGKDLRRTIKYVQNISNRVEVKGQNEKGRKEGRKKTNKQKRKTEKEMSTLRVKYCCVTYISDPRFGSHIQKYLCYLQLIPLSRSQHL